MKFLVTGVYRSVFPSNDFDSSQSVVSSNGLKWTPFVLIRNVYANVRSSQNCNARDVTGCEQVHLNVRFEVPGPASRLMSFIIF
ncbi:hypothetical protein DPMN_134519 [Dreissena polymorpha]|uniref:Uncharacterized protein n=1 Tax=Dreissena polymorpha TaxID=45954 RepID=A0A9D4FXC4_DREPO|nr:hypothetical protein DPMN_134519 [Dreissena polymorpha]